MADQNKQKRYFFLGIGGIGMSALARFYNAKGAEVAGYDRTRSELCKQLESEGIAIHYEDNVDMIPAQFKKSDETLIVFTPAIPAENAEFRYFKDNGFTMLKRAQLLGNITREHKGLCVAGTHGKTTTCNMIANILQQTSKGCNAFLGGIAKNYGTNYILSDHSDYVVIEAYEFDRSFHWLRPWMSVITATDPDHLDIYGTKEAYLESFRHYTTLIQPGGALIIHKNLEMKADVQEGVKVYDYSRDEGDFHAENIVIDNGNITFDFVSPIETVKGIELGQPVPINIENSVTAMAMAQLNGCNAEELRYGMKTFQGAVRRFDYKVRTPHHVFLSDYAHHPNEIFQSAKSLRELYKDRKITAIFQPHLYTRTRDFAEGFAEALSKVDKLILLDIYPAREEPIPGVTSEIIYDKVTAPEKVLLKKEELMGYLEKEPVDVLVTFGAGNIDRFIEPIEDMLKKRAGE